MFLKLASKLIAAALAAASMDASSAPTFYIHLKNWPSSIEKRAKEQLSPIIANGECLTPTGRPEQAEECHRFDWFKGDATREALKKHSVSRKLTLAYSRDKNEMIVQIYRWDGAKFQRVRNSKIPLPADVNFKTTAVQWSFK
ncbi:MAG TPA: hypothetical protein VFV50_02725 [Bdellovibrionales bacterium]|nr:hypothetical protein [Bdellovibrionales bacterium]